MFFIRTILVCGIGVFYGVYGYAGAAVSVHIGGIATTIGKSTSCDRSKWGNSDENACRCCLVKHINAGDSPEKALAWCTKSSKHCPPYVIAGFQKQANLFSPNTEKLVNYVLHTSIPGVKMPSCPSSITSAQIREIMGGKAPGLVVEGKPFVLERIENRDVFVGQKINNNGTFYLYKDPLKEHGDESCAYTHKVYNENTGKLITGRLVIAPEKSHISTPGEALSLLGLTEKATSSEITKRYSEKALLPDGSNRKSWDDHRKLTEARKILLEKEKISEKKKETIASRIKGAFGKLVKSKSEKNDYANEENEQKNQSR